MMMATGIVFASSCSNTCHTCENGGFTQEYCPDDVPMNKDLYMSSAESSCNQSGGTWI